MRRGARFRARAKRMGRHGQSGGQIDDEPDAVVRRRCRRRRIWIGLLLLVLIAGIVRAMLPWAVRDYVNRTLDRNPLYSGRIGQVQIHLLRGAYSIAEVSISKTTGNIPVPFFAAKRVDFAMEWSALLHRKVVGRVFMEEPELNFVDAPNEGEAQTGAG